MLITLFVPLKWLIGLQISVGCENSDQSNVNKVMYFQCLLNMIIRLIYITANDCYCDICRYISRLRLWVFYQQFQICLCLVTCPDFVVPILSSKGNRAFIKKMQNS
jgi:hypothetical protein